ncbi:MAG: hypothetical protein PWR16_848, partial [Methanoculleus sp.]|nr:hypothetical protein [Methanoculleus sp.]
MGVRKAEARKKPETVDRGGYRHTGGGADGECDVPKRDWPEGRSVSTEGAKERSSTTV